MMILMAQLSTPAFAQSAGQEHQYLAGYWLHEWRAILYPQSRIRGEARQL